MYIHTVVSLLLVYINQTWKQICLPKSGCFNFQLKEKTSPPPAWCGRPRGDEDEREPPLYSGGRARNNMLEVEAAANNSEESRQLPFPLLAGNGITMAFALLGRRSEWKADWSKIFVRINHSATVLIAFFATRRQTRTTTAIQGDPAAAAERLGCGRKMS